MTLPTNASPDTSEQPTIPALDESYGHARKAYGLVSALLIAWELIGVELEPSPIENVKVTLKSPQAAPYVLIALIIYFGFRMTIEWYQNDSRRRMRPASRIDFAVAHLIAITALALYAFQTLSKIQIANTAAPIYLAIFFAYTLVSAYLSVSFVRVKLHLARLRSEESEFPGLPALYLRRIILRHLFVLLISLGVAILAVVIKHDPKIIFAAGSGLLVGYLVGCVLWLLDAINRRIARRRRFHGESM